MSEMVEKVARALTIETMKLSGFWATLPTPTAQKRAVDIAYAEAVPLARVAIAAMREPTKHMRDCGNLECAWDAEYPTWQAMIDAALAAPPVAGKE